VYIDIWIEQAEQKRSAGHLTERTVSFPLVYAESKARLNSAGLYFSVSYNIQEPNIPYSKKIDRELVSRMKSVQRENVFVTEKKPTQKIKIPLYVNSRVPIKLHSVKSHFNGLNEKDNFKKSLKLKQKPNYLKINLPDNEQLVNNVDLVIQNRSPITLLEREKTSKLTS
jgi:hypothetical protein